MRDELEHLLDDDIDMAAMHLSEKLAYQAASSQSSTFAAADNEPSEFTQERYRKLIDKFQARIIPLSVRQCRRVA